MSCISLGRDSAPPAPTLVGIPTTTPVVLVLLAGLMLADAIDYYPPLSRLHLYMGGLL